MGGLGWASNYNVSSLRVILLPGGWWCAQYADRRLWRWRSQFRLVLLMEAPKDEPRSSSESECQRLQERIGSHPGRNAAQGSDGAAHESAEMGFDGDDAFAFMTR